MPFCPECLARSVSPLPPFCLECGAPYGPCSCGSPVPCYAASMYDGATRELILDFKYRNNRPIGKAMGAAVAAALPAPEADLAVAVPLHVKSRRAYNQSELIAAAAADVWGIGFRSGALKWVRETGPQMGKNSAYRRSLPEDSMSAARELFGKRVALVDDVCTTGATLRAARAAIERAGGKVSAAYVWSRRIKSEEDERAWRGAELPV